MSINRWLDSEDVVYIQWNTTQPQKKNKIMQFVATWTERETLIPSEVSQKEKDKYHVISLISGNLIYDTNECFHRKETHGLGEQTCVCRGEGEGVGWTRSLGLTDANYCIRSG